MAADDRLTNNVLGVVLVVAFASGVVSLAFGTPLVGTWVVTAHGVAGIALVVLSRRKGRIAGRSLRRRRRRPRTSRSLVLAALVLTTVVTGLVHGAGLTDHVGPLTLMQLHVGSAVLAVPFAVVHYRSRPAFRPRRPVSRDSVPVPPGPRRRALLQGAAVTAASGGLLVVWEGGLRVSGAPGADRRFTGSHETGSGDPLALPATQWLDDRVQVLASQTWRLEAAGRRLALDDVRSLPQEDVTAVLDCTGLWWSEQVWRGVRLDRLVDLGGAPSVEIRSATGYSRLLPAADLSDAWLALECGGQPLSAAHGYPARVVVPGRRGFWWVKWVVSIEPSPTPWWLQSPYPLT